MKLVPIAQGTPAWLAWRAQGLGSSDAAAVVGASPWRSRERLLREKAAALRGVPPEDEDNWAMARGRRLEPHARRLYEGLVGWKAPPACAQNDKHGWLRASVDGLVGGLGLALEIKCPGRADHELALAGSVPPKYVPQCLHLQIVTGARLVHYWSYSDRFPPGRQTALVEVPRVTASLLELFDAERAFWDEALALAAAG